MKPDNWNRFAAGLLAILLCLCSFSMPAFASGTDPAPEPLPEIIEEEPTTGGMEPEGVPITPKGNATLVDDFYGDKQLITVTSVMLQWPLSEVFLQWQERSPLAIFRHSSNM